MLEYALERAANIRKGQDVYHALVQLWCSRLVSLESQDTSGLTAIIVSSSICILLASRHCVFRLLLGKVHDEVPRLFADLADTESGLLE